VKYVEIQTSEKAVLQAQTHVYVEPVMVTHLVNLTPNIAFLLVKQCSLCTPWTVYNPVNCISI